MGKLMPWLVAVLAAVLIASSEALPQMGEGAAPVQLAPAATLKAAVRAQEKVAQAIIKVKRETAKAENQGAKMQQKLATAIDQDAGQQINAIEKQVSQKEQEYVKKAAGKAGKKDQLNWKITVQNNIISAKNTDPTPLDQFLTMNKYTEAMTKAEIAQAESMEVAGDTADGTESAANEAYSQEVAEANCDQCTNMCKTKTCKEWCSLRWCSSAPTAQKAPKADSMKSQEGINNAENENDVKPATAVVCKMCAAPADDEKAKWCKAQGCR